MRGRLTYANVMASVAVFIAIGGTATAALTGKDKKQVRKIASSQITTQAPGLSVAHATTAGSANSASPTGSAGGDLSGSYPNPSLKAPDVPTLAGLTQRLNCTGAPANSWSNYGPGAGNPAGAYRDRQGRVFLQGYVLQCGASPPAAVFTLPAGLRPSNDEHLAGHIPGGGVIDVDVAPQGYVQPIPPGTGNAVSLDGLSFRCGPSGQNGCP